MKSDRQILDSEYNEILLQTVAVIEKSRSMLAVQVSTMRPIVILALDRFSTLQPIWNVGVQELNALCRGAGNTMCPSQNGQLRSTM